MALSFVVFSHLKNLIIPRKYIRTLEMCQEEGSGGDVTNLVSGYKKGVNIIHTPFLLPDTNILIRPSFFRSKFLLK